METILDKPTEKNRELARLSLGLLEKALQAGSADDVTEIMFPGMAEVVRIPKKAMRLFTDIIGQMAEGNAVKLLGEDEPLSSQEAADYLHVSRPHLVKLVEKGEIPCTMVGTHRRIALHDLEIYADKVRANRDTLLAFLAKQAQELHLGYE